jgi:hypothetical protein
MNLNYFLFSHVKYFDLIVKSSDKHLVGSVIEANGSDLVFVFEGVHHASLPGVPYFHAAVIRTTHDLFLAFD